MSDNVKVFGLVKAGNAVEEYEDVCDYVPDAANPFSPRFSSKPSPFRFAIADGATESSFSTEWARLLTTGFAERDELLIKNLRSKEGRAKWLNPLREEWYKRINWDKLGWAAYEKAQRGAYATFLGLQLYPLTWKAWAVGDCVLFQVRHDELITTWPVENESDFGNSPVLLCSLESQNDSVLEKRYFLFKSGKHKAGDLFMLTTDALGQWFISDYHAGRKPWRDLEQITDNREFDEFVTRLRQESRIRNDDTTVIIIRPRNSLL